MKNYQQSQVRQDVYQMITDIICQKLAQGIIPWKQCWSRQGLAANYLTKQPYRGINALLLNSLGYAQPYFLTFRQTQQLGGHVRKGAKSLPVLYWHWWFIDTRTGKKLTQAQATALPNDQIQRKATLRYYRVFHVEDIAGIDFHFPAQTSAIMDDVAKLQQGFLPLQTMAHPVVVKTEKASPFYHPMHDYINMPVIASFPTLEAYFQVLYHELVHATGHARRLGRTSVTHPQPYGSWTYSQEELIAEMGASFLSNLMGLQTETELNEAAAYIQGWLKVLRNDKRFVVEAAQKAQRAVDYLLGQESSSEGS